MPKILIIEDEPHIIELLAYNLKQAGYDVVTALDGLDGYKKAVSERPDAIILDVMVPNMDGYEVCRRIRAHGDISQPPIIMVTAKNEEFDRILGLEIGADDYVTKPFSPRELVARVKARLRKFEHQPEVTKQQICADRVIIAVEQHEVFVDGEKVSLTFKEFELLKILAENRGKVLKREYLLDAIWGYDYICDSRTVDVHISFLRKKLEEDPLKPKIIETVRGIGYKMA